MGRSTINKNGKAVADGDGNPKLVRQAEIMRVSIEIFDSTMKKIEPLKFEVVNGSQNEPVDREKSMIRSISDNHCEENFFGLTANITKTCCWTQMLTLCARNRRHPFRCRAD